MKYLLVGLMLIVGTLGHGRAGSPPPVQTFASVQFRTSSAGVETPVEIDVSTFPGPVRIGLSIQRTRQVCGDYGCQDVPVIYGYTYQNAAPGDVLVDPSLDSASVHVTIFFHDLVTKTDVPVRVDAVWSASGPMRCADRYDETGCDRVATVTGEVAIGATPLIAGQTVSDGLLQWRGRDW